MLLYQTELLIPILNLIFSNMQLVKVQGNEKFAPICFFFFRFQLIAPEESFRNKAASYSMLTLHMGSLIMCH